jgi:hypothetical protein
MTPQEEMIESIKEHGKKARGMANLIKHLRGKRITQRQAIEAFCYRCQGYGESEDCDTETCSLFPFSPYGKKHRVTSPTSRHSVSSYRHSKDDIGSNGSTNKHSRR